jgi:hypothetical protein
MARAPVAAGSTEATDLSGEAVMRVSLDGSALNDMIATVERELANVAADSARVQQFMGRAEIRCCHRSRSQVYGRLMMPEKPG